MPVDDENKDPLLEGVMHLMLLFKGIDPPSKGLFLLVAFCGFSFLVLIFITLVKAEDGLALALGSVAFALGAIQLIISLKIMRSTDEPLNQVKEQVSRLRQILIEEKGVTPAQLDAIDTGSENKAEAEPPQMQEVSSWFERRDKLGETTKERRDHARAEVLARSHAIDAKRDDMLATDEIDLEASQSSGKRKSKRKTKVPQHGENVNISPLSPRHSRTEGKGKDAFAMSDLTPQQKQLVMSQMREKEGKDRQARLDTLTM